MPTDPMTITEAIDALSEDERDAGRIMESIRDVVDRVPASIEELFPGMTLTAKRKSRKEIADDANKASVARRQRQTDERYSAMVPFLQKWVNEDPDISLSQIKTKLTAEGFKPLRSATWNRASILYMLNRAGIKRD